MAKRHGIWPRRGIDRKDGAGHLSRRLGKWGRLGCASMLVLLGYLGKALDVPAKVATLCNAARGSGSSPQVNITLAATQPVAPRITSKAIIRTDGRAAGEPLDSPPVLHYEVQHGVAVHANNVSAFLGKRRHYRDPCSMPPVSGPALQVSSTGKVARADIQTSEFIASQNPETPHGLYRSIVKAAAEDGGFAEDSLEFNYVYHEDFADLDKALKIRDPEFTKLNPGGGLLATNTGRRVQAELRQTFDFNRNFFAKGRFAVTCGSKDSAVGLDIAFGHKWGERLAVIFCDGNLDGHSIKLHGDKPGDPEAKPRRVGASPGVIADGKTFYEFIIMVTQISTEQSVCRVFIGRYPMRVNDCVRVPPRIFDTRLLGEDPMHVFLKVRHPGVVKLPDLELGEIGDSVGLTDSPSHLP